jgi:hypothetical protein
MGQSEHQTGDLNSADPASADAKMAYLFIPFLTMPGDPFVPGFPRVKNGLKFNF